MDLLVTFFFIIKILFFPRFCFENPDLIAVHPKGLAVDDLPAAYREKYKTEFDFTNFGCGSLNSFCMLLPNLFAMEMYGRSWLLYPAHMKASMKSSGSTTTSGRGFKQETIIFYEGNKCETEIHSTLQDLPPPSSPCLPNRIPPPACPPRCPPGCPSPSRNR